MLSLFYIPVLIYDLIRVYLLPREESIQPDHSIHFEENDNKPDSSSSNNCKEQQIEITSSKLPEEPDEKESEPPPIVASDNHAPLQKLPIKTVKSEGKANQPEQPGPSQSRPASSSKTYISIGDSDDSDIDDYLSDIVSVTPSSVSTVSLSACVISERHRDSIDTKSEDMPSQDCAISTHQEGSFRENDHVMIVDEDEDDVSSSQNISSLPPTNSFSTLSSDSPSPEPPISGFSSCRRPVEVTCSSSNHAVVDSIAATHVDTEDDVVSRETNQMIWNLKSTNHEQGLDDPVQSTSLTSIKNSGIDKSATKDRRKRKRSDLEWNQYMEKCMLAGARTKILNSFRDCFKEASDSYRLCCELLITFGITHASGKSALQKAAVEEIKLWKEDNVAPRPGISNQLKALDISYLCNATLFPAISAVFELETIPAEEVVLFINDKLSHKRMKYLKHMALIITHLKLQDHFDTAEILLPLLGMDKLMTIEAYLTNSQIAASFVRSLDDLLEPRSDNLNSLLDHLNVNFNYNRDSANFKFTSEQITGLIKRMIQKHQLSSKDAPNVDLNKSVSNLKSLLYCKYRKGYNEDWTSSIVDSVSGCDLLIKVLFEELASYEDFEYAALLYGKLNRPDLILIPEKLHGHLKSRSVRVAEEDNLAGALEAESYTDTKSTKLTPASPTLLTQGIDNLPADPVLKDGYVSLPVGVSIYDVSTFNSLTVCQDVLSRAGVIGFDSEWKALIDPTNPSPVALIQLASSDSCFLLDVASLLECCNEAVIGEFTRTVFRDETVVVGYSLGQDLVKLRETIPILGEALTTHTGIVDLSVAHKVLTREERVMRSQLIRELVSEGKPLPDSDTISKQTGLARLCEMVFSRPLDKTYQVSDWTRRPLLPEQRIYAALDAYILLPLYHSLTSRFHPTPLQDLVAEEPVHEPEHVTYIPAYSQPTPVRLLRLVVDLPCQGLGKKLRHVGIDCVILDDRQSVDDAAKISLAQGRIILSRGGNCEKLRKLTDPGRVYKVVGNNATDQLAEIRQHFNLVVTDEDLFSRCALCNCPYFVKLAPEKARLLKEAQELYNSSTVEEQFEVFDRRQSCVETIQVTSNGTTQYGVRLQLDKVNINKFSEDKLFWGCNDCGKMYWDGCHVRNFKEKHDL